jgi:hypothetical protein
MLKKRFVVMIVALCLTVGFAIGAWAERQPHMGAALEHLREARAELRAAAPDKGGHKAEAIRLVDRAIRHVREGMEYADTH